MGAHLAQWVCQWLAEMYLHSWDVFTREWVVDVSNHHAGFPNSTISYSNALDMLKSCHWFTIFLVYDAKKIINVCGSSWIYHNYIVNLKIDWLIRIMKSIISDHVYIMAALQREKVQGFDAFMALAESLAQEGKKVYALFTGSVDPDTGSSWCPDCVQGRLGREWGWSMQYKQAYKVVLCTMWKVNKHLITEEVISFFKLFFFTNLHKHRHVLAIS